MDFPLLIWLHKIYNGIIVADKKKRFDFDFYIYKKQ
jgi:hypothetical protein